MHPVRSRFAKMRPAALVAVALACGKAETMTFDTTPLGNLTENSAIEVFVDEQLVQFTDTDGRIQGTITGVVTNNSPDGITLVACGSILERETAGAWRVVWHAICRLVIPEPERIAPGASTSTVVEILRMPTYPDSPSWSRPIGGSYRLRVALGSEGGTLPTEVSTSNAFSIP